MTPYERLLLFAASAAIAGAIAGLWVFVAWPVALAALLGGALIAGLSTVEIAPRSPAASVGAGTAAGDQGATIRRRDRDEIEESARASREAGE